MVLESIVTDKSSHRPRGLVLKEIGAPLSGETAMRKKLVVSGVRIACPAPWAAPAIARVTKLARTRFKNLFPWEITAAEIPAVRPSVRFERRPGSDEIAE